MAKQYRRVLWLSIIALYPVLILAFQPTTINTYDEAIILLGAMQVQNGVYPGNGFFTMYGPLQFFIVGELLDIFNGNILPVRLYHVLTVCITHLLLASLFRPVASNPRAAIACFFLVLSAFLISKQAAPLYPTHMLSLFGAVFVVWKTSEGDSNALLTAALLGLYLACFVFLAPISAFIVIAMLVVAVPFHLFNNDALTGAKVLRDFARLMLAFVVAAICVAVYEIVTNGSLWETLSFLLNEQIPAYSAYRYLPFPTLSQNSGTLIHAYFPLITMGLGGVYYFYCAAHRGRYSMHFRSALFWLLFFCLAFYPSGLVRTHPTQLWPTLLFALAAVCLILCRRLDHRDQENPAPIFAKSLFALSALLLAAFIISWSDRKNIFATNCNPAALDTPRVSCLHSGKLADWSMRQEQIAFLDDFLNDGERFFATQDRHDVIFVSDHDFYFLLDRLPFTYWAHLEPGIHTTKRIQELVIQNIEQYVDDNGRAIILIQPTRVSTEPNQSAVSSGVTLLDTYLRNCETVRQMGSLQIVVCT